MDKGHNIRGYTFWFMDNLKGNPIKKELEKTRDMLNGKIGGIGAKDTSLKALLKHATTTTKFYNNFSDCGDLSDFPIINKNIIRDNLKDICSSKYKIAECRKVTTSGSTGTPFSTYQNKKKIIKNIADNIYFSCQSEYRIGDYLSYIKIWQDKFTFREKLGFKMKNMHPQSIFDLSDYGIDQYIKSLNKIKGEISFIGYASAFHKICSYLDNQSVNPIEFKTKSVIAISESLSDYAKDSIIKYFGVQPFSRYSNNENGIIAQQVKQDDKRFRINVSSYIVEILNLSKDDKLNYGNRGRIIITDLYNYATPLIRYDTGDVGIMELDENNIPYFMEISGRKLDLLYDTQGNIVPSHLSSKLCKYGNLRQFQLIQKSKTDYQVNLNTNRKVDEIKLIEEFKGYFGEYANIQINYVTDIPLLSSGKVREVVNEYYSKTLNP